MYDILLFVTALAHLSRAASVYLYPPFSSTTDPAATLSRHLGLDAFEPLPVLQHNDPPFLGRDSNAIFLTLDVADAAGELLPTPPDTTLTFSQPSYRLLFRLRLILPSRSRSSRQSSPTS